jgi:hypothetical protein
LTDRHGRVVQTTILTLNPSLQNVRELEAEDLLWLSGAPQGGFPAQLPWAALAPNARNLTRRTWSGFVQFSTPEALDSPAQLTLFRFEGRRTELPFEFRDLPLP